jgi:hypothetical protein
MRWGAVLVCRWLLSFPKTKPMPGLKLRLKPSSIKTRLFIESTTHPKHPSNLLVQRQNTHSHPKTHGLFFQCRENMFCSSSGPSNGTCVFILCRRDEFPFGFGGGDTDGLPLDPNVKLLNLPIPVPTSTKRKSKKDRPKDLTIRMVFPPLCIGGSFCPDDGSGCRQQNTVGGSCELGRDEQLECAGDLIDAKSTVAKLLISRQSSNTTVVPQVSSAIQKYRMHQVQLKETCRFDTECASVC